MANKLVLIEKYDEFLNYIYPKLQQIPRNHGILKAKVITTVFEQPELFYKAVKSNQISKLYEADAGLATIRHQLRFLSTAETIVLKNGKRTKGKFLLDKKAHQVASIKLAEVGKIIGSMFKK